MATVSRGLPERPHLDVPKREARTLLEQWRSRNPDALDRIRRRHPRFTNADDAAIAAAHFRLADAQLVLAREYGFPHWTALKQRIDANTPVESLRAAIQADDRENVVRILQANPQLLHVPLWSGNWGPPMSHAANLGRLEIIKLVADLGALDFQHAFDRAVLQGKIDCARWLHAHGATLVPGIVMGTCETLNPAGLRFLAELNAPFTNERGDRLAPLALALETYCRNPEGKHALLAIFAERGYHFPDTPMMAFHRGRIDLLEQHRRRDPNLLSRRFTLRDIYPPELGCAPDERSGMHWTPIDGTTLLHLSIDFAEQEVFDWLLAHGADVNARATAAADGFGGHTPLFHTVVSGPWSRLTMLQSLLARGASTDTRASLHKFLDWRESPFWHEARNVTAVEWGRGFPDPTWVSAEALRLLGAGA